MSVGQQSSSIAAWTRPIFGRKNKRGNSPSGARINVNSNNVVSTEADDGDIELDPLDENINAAIARLERKSFIFDGLIPEIQCLLAVPAASAKQAYLSALTQYSLVCMLVLAALLGSALHPLNPDDYPDTSTELTQAYNMWSMIICCAQLFGTTVFLLDSIIMEGTPVNRVHSIIAKSDPLFCFGTYMVAFGIQGMLPLVLMRAWIGESLDFIPRVVLSVVCFGLYVRMSIVYFQHLQGHFPVVAQRWAKMLFPVVYKKKISENAIDDLVQRLRYLQQPRTSSVSAAQLGMCLEKYFGNNSIEDGTADVGAFMQLVEQDAGGRLAAVSDRFARRAFDKALDAQIEKLSDQALSSSNFDR